MDPITQYHNAIVEAINKIVEKERESIARAAALLADKNCRGSAHLCHWNWGTLSERSGRVILESRGPRSQKWGQA
jgi:hypothetical protein